VLQPRFSALLTLAPYMEYSRTLSGGLLMLLVACTRASALELHPDQVKKDLVGEVVEITVMEPHMKCCEANCTVTYVGIPLGKLLQYYFPDTWEGFNGIIDFIAQDGYLAAMDASKVREQHGYLTFARADDKPFLIDNEQQNEKDLPLGPFYLVWDNLGNEALQKEGAYGWPYQVVRIELSPASVYDRLLPAGAPPAVREGFEAWKTYCLGCHRIDGVGGTKYAEDLRQRVRGMSRDELRTWISCPRSMRGGTTMPPLNTRLGRKEREQLVERIIDYLETP